MLCKQIRIKFISMGSYFPEGHAFGTLITSTKVADNLQNSLTMPLLTILI